MTHGIRRGSAVKYVAAIMLLIIVGLSGSYFAYQAGSGSRITTTQSVTSTATSVFTTSIFSTGTVTKTVTLPQSTTTGTAAAPGKTILVDSCGASPYNDQSASDAIQECINEAKSGDTILFTSPGAPGYKGYQIDKTIFLVMTSPVQTNLTFASTNPGRPALLNATNGLLGFVVQLCARSQVNCGLIHNIVLSNLQIDGGKGRRSLNDNWGSWLPECTVAGDSWCTPGGINIYGGVDSSDPSQNYKANPNAWSTGIVVEDMIIQNVPDGTALLFGGASGTIRNNIIESSGDHIFGAECPPQVESGAWADGITFTGPDNLVTGNIVYDASDIGIVFFGGENTTISNNVVVALPGDNGMFAGIAVHAWTFGDVSGVQVIGNRVENEGSSDCGGINAGINIGPQMWGGGCVANETSPSAVGNSGPCTANPPVPNGALCTVGQTCQVWAYVKADSSLTLANNVVVGAYVNYLVDGLDLVGSFVSVNNTSFTPGVTNWPAAINGCTLFGATDSWGPTNFVAYDPTLPGWTDIRIQCAS